MEKLFVAQRIGERYGALLGGMAMRNVKNANYVQINNDKTIIKQLEGVEILRAIDAWNRYKWTRKHFDEKPRNGYFIWAKKTGIVPLTTCAAIEKKGVIQKMNNLIVIEKGVKARAIGNCFSIGKRLKSRHEGKGKIIIKEGASLSVEHLHLWGENDELVMNYEFVLGKNARLEYKYRCLKPGREMKIKTRAILGENASAELLVITRAKKLESSEEILLKGKNSKGTVKIRIVGEKDSIVRARTLIDAQNEGKGHLDCQGLIVEKNASIELIPVLKNSCRKAILTHEASIGAINDEELAYLMSRGIAKKNAIKLIVNGFLKS